MNSTVSYFNCWLFYICDALSVRYATGNDGTHHLLAFLVPIGIHRVIDVVAVCRFKVVLGGRQLGWSGA